MSKRLRRMSDPEFYSLIAGAPVLEAIIKKVIAVEEEMEDVFRIQLVVLDRLEGLSLSYGL